MNSLVEVVVGAAVTNILATIFWGGVLYSKLKQINGEVRYSRRWREWLMPRLADAKVDIDNPPEWK